MWGDSVQWCSIVCVCVGVCSRYEKMAEQEELNYQQQRRRLFGEVAQEKEKMAEQLHRQKENFNLKQKETLELHNRYVPHPSYEA